MSTPGSNILNKAFRLIARQSVAYYAYAGRSTNSYGVDVPVYMPPVEIRGSLQAVPQNYYVTLGLDFQKTYVMFYCPKMLMDIQRDVSGDIIQYGTSVYSVESLTDWFNIDGWVQALAVRTESAVADENIYVVDPAGLYLTTPDNIFIVEP